MCALLWTVLVLTDISEEQLKLVENLIETKARLQLWVTLAFAEEGLLKEVGTGYSFFWSGRKKEERRESFFTFFTLL